MIGLPSQWPRAEVNCDHPATGWFCSDKAWFAALATPHLAGLLLTGSLRAGGNVGGDPDGNPDVIGVK